MSVAIKRNPELWARIVAKVKSENTGGTMPGQWSARKAQIAVKRYKDSGGTYVGSISRSNSLHRWTKQNWRTRSGAPSHISGERYLPAKAIQSLSPKEYERVSASKRRAMRLGHQYSPMPRSIINKVKKFRR
jgi:hypothetical protein